MLSSLFESHNASPGGGGTGARVLASGRALEPPPHATNRPLTPLLPPPPPPQVPGEGLSAEEAAAEVERLRRSMPPV